MIYIVVERCTSCPFLVALDEDDDGETWACVAPSFDAADEEPARRVESDITASPPDWCLLRGADRLVTLRVK